MITIILCITGLILLLNLVNDIKNGFAIILSIIIYILFFVIPIAVIILFVGIIDKFPYTLPRLKKEYLLKINKPFFNYYQISNDCVITKCYSCSDERFVNKDVIVYLYNGNIRITNNFYWNKYDIGCYEIEEYKDFKIILGRRALAYIRQHVKKS